MNSFRTGAGLASLSVVALLAACASKPAEPSSAPEATPLAQAPAPAAPAPMLAQSVVIPGSLADFQQNVGDRVFFEYDRAEITPAGRDTLQRQAAWLQRYPAVVLVVEGHADERGTREYNLALGARRAAAVHDYLATLGVSASRLEGISYGKERPVCGGSNEGCWQQNRRGVSTIKSGAVS